MRKTRSDPRMPTPLEYPERILSVLTSLEISTDLIAARSLALHPEARELVVAEIGDDGREYLLTPAAAAKWREMSAAALSDGIVIKIGSAFRSVDRQAEIIRDKLARGLSLDAVLCVSAPPGYSEHHTGRAIDVTTTEGAPLEPEFEETKAFRWLSTNAGRFGFVLSYPAGNPYGYDYEPWHWCFRPTEV
jgi:zinc D-Ala-D-Ala carboxypeptidase